MEIVVITFSLEGMTESDYLSVCDEVAPPIAAVQGLTSKVFLVDQANGVYGGVYTFEDSAAADAYLASDLGNVVAIPGFVDVEVRRFGVLLAPTAVTRGLAPAAA